MSQGKQIYYNNLRENIRNMHPRFKELAVQAGAYEDGGTILTGPMDTAKFAELIVRECAAVCDLYGMPDGTSQTAIILSIAIKSKFGVK